MKSLINMSRALTRAIAILVAVLAASPALAAERARRVGDDLAVPESPSGARYHVITFLTGMDADRLTRAVGNGQLRLDDGGTFRLDVSQARMDLAHGCPSTGDVCRRDLRRRRGELNIGLSGTFSRSPGEVHLQVSGPGGAVENVRGFTDSDMSVIAVPFVRQNGLQLVIALRERRHAEQPSSPAGSYAWSRRGFDFSQIAGNYDGGWPTHRTLLSHGAVTFHGHHMSAQLETSSMSGGVTCQGSPCALTSTLEHSENEERFTGLVSMTTDGGIRVTSSTGLRATGSASPDGSFIVLAEQQSAARQALSILTRRGNGMSARDLQGRYGVITMEEFLDTSAHVRTFQPAGSLVFDGAGGWSFAGANVAVDRGECTGQPPLGIATAQVESAPPCGTASIATFGPVNAGAAGTYAVGANGDVTQQGVDTGGGSVSFTGNVTPDGRIFVLRRREDSMPCTFFCNGAESVRSLVIGIRQN